MDFTNRAGHTVGTGGIASSQLSNLERRKRMEKLAEETISLSKDPYFFKNHLGSYECKLCLTLHLNEGSYLAHTQGKKHQSNLNKRKITEEKNKGRLSAFAEEKRKEIIDLHKIKRKFVKIGTPAYKIMKMRDCITKQKGIKFEVYYPHIKEGVEPKYRIMSEAEVKAGKGNRKLSINEDKEECQYIIFAGEPYENIGIKIPDLKVDYSSGKHVSYWDENKKIFYLNINFKEEAN